MNYSEEEIFLIALSSIKEFDYKNKYSIYEFVKNENGFDKKVEGLKNGLIKLGISDYYNAVKSVFDRTYVEYLLRDLEKQDIIAVTIESDAYPDFLRETEFAPIVLYAKGDISLLKGNIISIVGSRKSLPISINIAERYASDISESGFTICTGIAEGVDVTVLKTVLNLSGKVISVLAGGFNNVYPKNHQNVFDKVCEYGLVISENPPDTVSKPYMFPIRNRIIAGLANGVIIINGGIKSGTIHTAKYALEYGKELFAVPYSIGIISGMGNNELIKRGATLTDSPQDILEFYGIEKKEVKQQLSENEKKIISAIEKGKCHVEEISDFLNTSVKEVTTVLALMEIKGLVVKDGINTYGLCK